MPFAIDSFDVVVANINEEVIGAMRPEFRTRREATNPFGLSR